MRFILLFFVISLIAKPLELELHAKSAILMNADTGAILYEKGAHEQGFPASTTKVATALFALDRELQLETSVVVGADCLKVRKDEHPYHLDRDSTLMGLKRGEVVTYDALLHGLMLVSGNDAANVLADALGGSVEEYVEEMNAYLAKLGCRNTHFVNPHGLTHEEHYTTPYDLALITKRALQLPKFREIISTLSYQKPRTNKQPPIELKLNNPFMKPTSRYYYPKAIGVKTGYTAAAQYPFVGAASQEGRTLIAVVFGCEKSADRFEDAQRLFEAAFAEEPKKRRLLGPENIFVKEVPTSKTPLKAVVAKPLSVEFFPAEEPKCKAALHWDVASFPVAKGQKVGEVHIQDERGTVMQKGDLIALTEVKESFYLVIKQWLLERFD